MVETKAPVIVGPRLIGQEKQGPPLRRRRGRTSRPLGPVAYLIMQIVDALGVPHASGMNVEEALSDLLGEVVDTGQVYVTLRRQKERGLLADQDVLSPNGSGHRVTVYSVTEAGRAAMAASARFYEVVAGPLAKLG